ncbi:MAG TPA: NosD domain-containing protein, partial [Pirellulaceae bacterium]|nr:NosD domain-containing protein [Pirellulaceae bacterium]
LTDNVVGGPGITIDGGLNNTVTHNQIIGSGTAITLTGSTAGAAIEANTIFAGSVALGLAGRSRALPLASPAAKGIVVASGGASGLWLHGNQILGVGTGIALNAVDSGQIADNRIVALSTGLTINASWTGPIQRNDIQGAIVGVVYGAAADLSNNRIHNNQTGVVSTVAGAINGLGFVGSSAANQIFANATGVQLTGQMQGQHVYANATGVIGSGVLGGSDLDHANVIERNTTGVSFAGSVSFNRVARNTVGITASGQTIDHNLIYRNTAAGVRVVGANVEVLQNTFYTTQGNGLELPGPVGQAEVISNVFWAGGGYDLWLVGDIRGGFLSDYNDLYAEGTGLLVHWLKDFADVLDWQADVARWDLHSIGRTVVNPQGAQPQFADLARDDFRVSGLAAGLRFSSPTIDGGDPRLDLALQPGQQNLLLNSSFESGLTGWSTNAGAAAASSPPGAFDGTNFFSAGTLVLGFAEQTIDLASQYPAVQLDSQDLVVVFGGRIRAASEMPPDRGRLLLTFQDGSGQQISQTIVTATNTTGRWELVGDRVVVPIGARKLVYRFETARISGVTNDGWLDHAFVFVRPEAAAPDQGAYGNAATDSDLLTPHLALRTPDLYVDWERDKPQT